MGDDSYPNKPMMQLIDGKTLAKTIRKNVKARVKNLAKQPGLAIILVGNDPASHVYVALKERACKRANIHFEKYLYFATETDEEIIKKIEELNKAENIHGILVQLPLPNHDENRIIAAIDPNKDVDGFHKENLARMNEGKPSLISPVALGVNKLIDTSGRPVSGLHAVIVASDFFAHPIATLLNEHGITSEIAKSTDPDLTAKTKKGDILIVALGKPGLITKEHVREGAVIIDIGTTRVDEKIVGDVDQESVSEIAGWLTPVPGGVGPMTVAMLLVNVLKAQQLQKTKKSLVM